MCSNANAAAAHVLTHADTHGTPAPMAQSVKGVQVEACTRASRCTASRNPPYQRWWQGWEVARQVWLEAQQA